MGTAVASAGAAGPSRDYGLDGAADGISQSTPLNVDDTDTLPSRSGPKRQSDAVGCMGLGARLLALADEAWAGIALTF